MDYYYREAYNIFASNGILFNHESEVRGETLLHEKLLKVCVRLNWNAKQTLFRNLEARRDWGHAKDY